MKTAAHSYGSCDRDEDEEEMDDEEEEEEEEHEPGCKCGGGRCCVKVFPTGYWPELKKTINLSLGLVSLYIVLHFTHQ